MTKKRYPKTARVSRSTPARRERRYPFERRYAQLQGDDPHPIDLLVDRFPRVRTLDRKLVRLSHGVQKQVPDRKGFIRYEDLRGEQRSLREQLFFDAGHQQGRLDGVVESLNSSVKLDADARRFARRIDVARLSSKLTAERVLAVLLEIARGLVLTNRRRTRGARR